MEDQDDLIFRFMDIVFYFPLTGEKPTLFLDYLPFPSYFWTVSIFTFCRYCRYGWLEGKVWTKEWIKKLVDCSFGVYLMHILVLALMQKFRFLYDNALLWHFGGPIMCYLICISIIGIVKNSNSEKNLSMM